MNQLIQTEDASIYVCGGSSMANDVKAITVTAWRHRGCPAIEEI